MLRRVLLALLLMAGPACAGSGTYAPLGAGGAFGETTDAQGIFYPKTSIWDYSAAANGLQVNSDHSIQVNPQISGDIVVTPSSSFTRPANTTVYTINTIVANSTTAGSVVPLSWTAARVNGGNGYVRRAVMVTSNHTLATAGSFLLHLYNGTAAPTTASGDNAAFSAAVTEVNDFCTIPITLDNKGSDNSTGRGQPDVGSECNFVTGGSTTTIWGILAVTSAYTPLSAEVEKIILEIHQN